MLSVSSNKPYVFVLIGGLVGVLTHLGNVQE